MGSGSYGSHPFGPAIDFLKNVVGFHIRIVPHRGQKILLRTPPKGVGRGADVAPVLKMCSESRSCINKCQTQQ